MPVAIPQYQTPGPNPLTRVARRREGSCGREPMRSRRACGSRIRCLPGSLGRTLVARLRPLAAATVLSVPHLILPATPAATACETKERLGHRGAVLLPAGAFASLLTSGGLRIDPWRIRESGERAGSADLPGRRWSAWSADRFAQPGVDGGAWTGSREMIGHGLVLISSFLSTAGDSAAPGVRSLALDWGPVAPMRLAVEPGRRSDALIDPLGADCERGRLLARAGPSHGVGDAGSSAGYRYESDDSPSGTPPSVRVARTEWFPVRDVSDYSGDKLAPTELNGDGSGGPLRPWRTASGMSPSRPDLNGGAGTGVEPGAALGFGPHRSRELGRVSRANRHAYPGDRVDWNGDGRIALSGLCFEGEGRGPC